LAIMSAATDRWRAVREYRLYPQRLAGVQAEAGDTLAAILDRIERVAEGGASDETWMERRIWAEVLRIIREGEPS
jgi:hypothetical protein